MYRECMDAKMGNKAVYDPIHHNIGLKRPLRIYLFVKILVFGMIDSLVLAYARSMFSFDCCCGKGTMMRQLDRCSAGLFESGLVLCECMS